MSIANRFWSLVEQLLETKNDELPKEPVNVIIGLGIDLAPCGTKASPYSKAVALKARDLFKAGHGKNILFTGGFNLGGITEAEAMHNTLVQNGYTGESWLEKQSKRTYQNADYALPLMKKMGWKTAIIVAQQWHTRRARATFKKRWKNSGIKFYVVKAHSSYGGGSLKRLDSFPRFALWDALAFIYSKLKGYC